MARLAQLAGLFSGFCAPVVSLESADAASNAQKAFAGLKSLVEVTGTDPLAHAGQERPMVRRRGAERFLPDWARCTTVRGFPALPSGRSARATAVLTNSRKPGASRSTG